MPHTSDLFTVNAVGDPEPITCKTDCKKIIIGEDPSVSGWPTVAYKIRAPHAASAAHQRPAGTRTEFVSATHYKTGDIVGYVETVSGSTSFFQWEE